MKTCTQCGGLTGEPGEMIAGTPCRWGEIEHRARQFSIDQQRAVEALGKPIFAEPPYRTVGLPQASGRTEQFKFNLGHKVLVREIQRPGVIEALRIDYLGVQYRVAYWDNSKRESVWLPADELEARG